jgi:hypothetical protein
VRHPPRHERRFHRGVMRRAVLLPSSFSSCGLFIFCSARYDSRPYCEECRL